MALVAFFIASAASAQTDIVTDLDGGPRVVEDAGTAIEDAGSPSVKPVVEPPLQLDAGFTGNEVELSVGGSIRLSETLISRFQVDERQTVAPDPFEVRVRVAPELKYGQARLFVEFDAVNGAVIGTPGPTIVADRTPVRFISAVELRQAFLEYRWATGALRLGQQTSQFGLGILSNSGATDAAPGDFGQARYGSLAWRLLAIGRPLYDFGGAWRAVEPVLAADLVVRDGTADFYEGDRAFQGIIGLRFNAAPEKILALTAIYRYQRAEIAPTGERATDAVVIDLAGRWKWDALSVGFELAAITGTTTQGRTTEAPVMHVNQLGALGKVAYQINDTTLMLDVGYASGDNNPYDDQNNAFRFDRDTHAGLILFDQVIGYQTARTALRLSDPTLTGYPPESINLLPTGGSITSAAYFFPRVSHHLADWLDVYGGPLVAFSTAKLTDPYNSRLTGGGATINAFGSKPGDYLGTEVDLGMQGKWDLTPDLHVAATLEGGAFFPGNAFAKQGGRMDPVGLVRLRVSLSL